jgi:hypothetical protein
MKLGYQLLIKTREFLRMNAPIFSVASFIRKENLIAHLRGQGWVYQL